MSKNDEIVVKLEETWEECGHSGCSGAEGLIIIATKGTKEVVIERASCFGIDREDMIRELLEEWDNWEK